MPPQNPYPKHQKGHWAELKYKGNPVDQIKIVRGEMAAIKIFIAAGINDVIYDDWTTSY
jgi:hypothetical protein